MTSGELFKEIEYKAANELKELYSIKYFSLCELNYSEKLYTVFVEFKDSASLELNWQRLNSAISVELKPFLTTEFSKWNLYLFLIVSERVSKEIKYVVENNKFSSRKIVLDNFRREFGTDDISTILTEHITNTDLMPESDSQSIQGSGYKSDTVVWKTVADFQEPLKKGKDDHIRLEQVLLEIENKLKDEVQKS